VLKQQAARRAAVLVLAALVLSLAGAVLATQELHLGEHDFDWSAVEQERARFRWSVEVINDTNRPFDVEVSIDLLDDDDSVLHTDTGSVTVVAGGLDTFQHEGSMPFDDAAKVTSFRFQLKPSVPASR
jgi:hypothetical protein